MVPTKSKSVKRSKTIKKLAKPAKKASKVSKKPIAKKVVKKAVKENPSFNITKHTIVPKHRIMSEKEVEALLKTYNISIQQLPLLKEKDPVVEAIGAEVGSIIEIKRDGPTNSSYFFRRVVE